MSEEPVTYEVADRVAWLTLNRPRVLNALNTELAATLADHIERAAHDRNAMLIVIRGAGRAFCSGMDRTALAQGSVNEPFFREWIRGLNALEDTGKLSIAVLHGYSIGGGLQLALACDFRIATDDAIIGLGATRHGLVPDGAVLRLARIVGLGRAKELALLNDEIPAAEARAIGLVNWVCSAADLDRTVHGVIAKARAGSPTATAHTKRLLQESFHENPRGLIEDVVQSQNACIASWEMVEANQAWQEKREAQFFQEGKGEPCQGSPSESSRQERS